MTDNATPIRTLLALIAMAVFVGGCATAKPTETEAGTAVVATPAPATTAAETSTATDSGSGATESATTAAGSGSGASEPAATTTAALGPWTQWVVHNGEHLWGISAHSEVYGDPYQWPLLFKKNRHQIEDADLIYPGQVLQIERDLSEYQIQQAIDHAKTRGAWSLGVTEATDLQYLEATEGSDASGATAGQAQQMIAQASSDLDAVKAAGGVWRLIDPATGGSAVGITKLLKVAKSKLEAGEINEAYRIAGRVSAAAQLGLVQVASEITAGPIYN